MAGASSASIAVNRRVPTFLGRACARIGLLGNPSDGYRGRVIAMTLPAFEAQVRLAPADDWRFANIELLHATVEALASRHPEMVEQPGGFSVTTSIPRQVGLSGSSAIIIAALRTLAERCGHQWDLVELAKIALEVETEVLGWTAGPQDRVVQAYEGLLDMDFSHAWDASGYERLDATRLPPMFVAWNQTMGEPSSVAHTNVRERWEAGDENVTQTMKRFAELATEGRDALDNGSASSVWPRLMAEAFELRSGIWPITSIDRTLVETGQALGAGVAFAGSGGAVVGSVCDQQELDALARAYETIGAGFLALAP